jgi:nicotinate-nucleotide adenylyltransferase
MEFVHKAAGQPSRAGILPGTFNPLTIAHLALAHAAAPHVDEIVFVLPRQLPHKPFSGASFEQRIAMLKAALRDEPACSIATSDGGLFLDIGVECRTAYGENAQLTFLCGRDAAERIATWDYGGRGSFEALLTQFNLLVASRCGEYEPPPGSAHAVRALQLNGHFDHVSSSEIRERIARGEGWKHLVPPALREAAEEIYGNRSSR